VIRPAGTPLRPAGWPVALNPDKSGVARPRPALRFGRPAVPVASLLAAGSAWPGARGKPRARPFCRGAHQPAFTATFSDAAGLLHSGRLRGTVTDRCGGAALLKYPRLRSLRSLSLPAPRGARCPTSRPLRYASRPDRRFVPRCGTHLAPGLAPGAYDAFCSARRTVSIRSMTSFWRSRGSSRKAVICFSNFDGAPGLVRPLGMSLSNSPTETLK